MSRSTRAAGKPLPHALRAFMERGFGADFSEVRLHASQGARELVRRAGARALTVGRHILLGFAQGRLFTPAGRLLLAHELAHVVQKRLGARSGALAACTAAEEREAAWAALRVCAGGTAECRVPSDPARVAAWGEVGHFYTVYFVMLAVGMAPKRAQHIAFFTQFPDEVEELDAATIGVRYAGGRIMSALARSQGAGGPGISPKAEEALDKADAESDKYMQLIYRGLHALTGAKAEVETKRRIAILDEMGQGDKDFEFEYGLALHPFGDSFAHRDGNTMFKPPVGHGLHGNEPDTISFGRQTLYLRYVNEMYAVTAAKMPKGVSRLSQEETASTLKRLCAAGSALNVPQPLQSGWIRQWSHSRMGVPMSDYNPLKYDCVPFAEFVDKPYSRLAGCEKRHLGAALELARKWS